MRYGLGVVQLNRLNMLFTDLHLFLNSNKGGYSPRSQLATSDKISVLIKQDKIKNYYIVFIIFTYLHILLLK